MTDDTGETTSDTAQDAAAGPATPRPRAKATDVARWTLIVVVIIGALVGLYYTGRAATTGLDSSSGTLPSSVDRLIPAGGDQVLRQTRVGIDVADGYDATLTINGVPIRGADDGLISDLGTGLVLFQPAEGQPIEELNQGRNCVVASVWKQTDGPSTAEPVSWCFNAT